MPTHEARPTLHLPRARGLRGVLGVHPGPVLAVLAALFVPLVASTYWTFNVMVGLVLGISCLGLAVLVGWAREISLVQAGLTGSALYITGGLTNGMGGSADYPFPVAAACGTAFAVAVSLVTSLVAARLAGAYVIVLTLSVQFWLENSVMISERLTGGLSEPSSQRPNFFGIAMRSDERFYFLVLGVVVVSLVFLHRLRHSRFGRSIILVGADGEAAAVVGVSPWRYRVWAFCIAGFFAGIAGALSAPLYFSPPGTLQYISFNSLFYLAVPVLAGFDSLTGVVAVAVTFSVLPQVYLEAKLNVYLLGGLGMAAGVLLGPRGLSGATADLVGPRRRRSRASEAALVS